ncbi:hypothetical protein HYE32_03870 [Mycoplasmopsis bovis]|nr:hypothetical protein [Mycoplasmopsis bovis]QQH22368.1 hypothetical protein HYE32_03870 [Mycoplasmopsis bovis]
MLLYLVAGHLGAPVPCCGDLGAPVPWFFVPELAGVSRSSSYLKYDSHLE